MSVLSYTGLSCLWTHADFASYLKRNSSKIEIQKEEIDKYVWLPLEETFQLLKCGRTKFPKNFDYSVIFEKVRNIYYSQSKGNTQREE